MDIAERLYNLGLISYPRTETTKFAPSISIGSLVSNLEAHPDYAEFVT